MRRRHIVLIGIVLALYAGWQGLRSALNTDFQWFVDPGSVADAQARRMYLGAYDVACRDGIPHPGRPYAVRPFRKKVGPLLVGVRTVVTDAVSIFVPAGNVMWRTSLEQWRAARNEALYLVFEDGAGVNFSPDGRTAPIEGEGQEEYGTNRVGCCDSVRSHVPDRFWLTARDGTRLCTFTFDESTRTEAPPRTEWRAW